MDAALDLRRFSAKDPNRFMNESVVASTVGRDADNDTSLIEPLIVSNLTSVPFQIPIGERHCTSEAVALPPKVVQVPNPHSAPTLRKVETSNIDFARHTSSWL
ncbi:hypothetical protein OGAPHI_006959 [Ogataea philodendri]|uniref:Uncharacterized protein n=1 Tax=Ogataea philodendri TaxID=1378263 RepID=A0A9P8NUZ9_9ASCO|nr:uncharacterized protein OGAPHI_006959 [Ogataea philodendri]KAH3660373.1 hypothetical protein OGAPHI_006959 [Ogataea philodendri]